MPMVLALLSVFFSYVIFDPVTKTVKLYIDNDKIDVYTMGIQLFNEDAMQTYCTFLKSFQ